MSRPPGSNRIADGRLQTELAPPSLNVANLFTMLRVFLVPVVAALLLAGGPVLRWWACGIFTFAAATDAFDGWVARRLNRVTRWGQLVDPAADKVLIGGSLVVLAWLGEIAWWVVIVVVARELAVTIQRQVLLRRGTVMPASVYGKAKTISQVVAVTLYLVPTAPRPLATAALAVAILFTVASGLEYAWRGRRITHAG